MAESHNFLSADEHFQQHSQPANRSDHQSNSPQPTTHASIRVVPWRVRDLTPHPSYAQLGIKIPASRLNELLELGEDAFVFPLSVTSTGIVIDGYTRLEIARLQGRETLMCVEFDIPEEEALRRLILCHRRLPGLPPFCRVKLAVPLAKSLKEKALQHQQNGGKNKGSSKLTEAQTIDVRKRIAALVGISVGTLSHASHVLKKGDSEVSHALCNGEIKIDRAWRWAKESQPRQRENLKLYRRHRGMERVAQTLITKQLKKLKSEQSHASRWKAVTPNKTVAELSFLSPQVVGSINVVFIKAPGPVLALSEDLAQQLGFREEAPLCNSKDPTSR
jgi:hypothetical protein